MPTFTNPHGQVQGSSGGDLFIFDTPLSEFTNLEGNNGFDTLDFDWSGGTSGAWFRALDNFAHGTFNGSVRPDPYGPFIVFGEVESVVFTGSTLDDRFELDLSPLSGSLKVDFDGGAGFDTADLNLSDVAATMSFVVGANGISSNFGMFAGIEQFTIYGGTGKDTFVTGAGNDRIYSGGGADTIDGGAGNDIISSGAGSNVDGGDGDDLWTGDFSTTDNNLSVALGDTITVSNGTTAINVENVDIGSGAGDDNIVITRNRSGQMYAGAGFDILTSNVGGTASLQFQVSVGPNGTLRGYAGKTSFTDVERVDFTGGTGADMFRIFSPLTPQDVRFDGGAGNDTLDASFFDTAAASRFVVAADGTIDSDRGTYAGFEKFTLRGGNGDDQFVTGAGNDYLNGEGGNDALSGGGGSDTILGGTGNDIVFGGGAGDYLYGNEGSDSLDGGDGADKLFGGQDDDVLAGGRGDDLLDGGSGADEMKGGIGNDIYVVDHAGDAINELNGEGTDRVEASIGFTLAGIYVENLTLTGSAALPGTGNGFANTLIGNDGANFLNGAAGADAMSGGFGNDRYVVDNLGDSVTESSAEGGTDRVDSAVTFTLGANIENLLLTGSATIYGTGNGLANNIIGNSAGNILDGGAGADILEGKTGSDRYIIDNAGDKIVELADEGIDTAEASISFSLAGQYVETLRLTGTAAINGTGNNQVNSIYGNSAANVINAVGGDDKLYGGDGKDTLTGGAGLDRFIFDSALSAGNVDKITDFNAAEDGIYLNMSIFRAIASGTLASTAFVAGTAALDAGDRIIHDKVSGNIFYDADGSGAGAAILFATVTAGTILTSADFIAY